MRKTILAFIILASLYSCNKEPQPLSKAEIKQRIDSITSIRIRESDEMARKDLDHRMKIEVKVKVDSIINAKYMQATTDSLQKRKGITQPALRPAVRMNKAVNI